MSIDIPDVSKQRLREYLNEDLLNPLDVSPMVKNILKDAPFEKNNIKILYLNIIWWQLIIMIYFILFIIHKLIYPI